jgi:hypothetical protein
MSKYKVLFKGKNTEVWYTDKSIAELAASAGVEVRPDGLYKDGKRIYVVRRPFRAFFPRLIGKEGGGSVCRVADGIVTTNWHVADVASTLQVSPTESYPVTWTKLYKPDTMNPVEYLIRRLLNYLFGMPIPTSKYDYAAGTIDTQYRYDALPILIFFAGNCLTRDERGCIGLALPIPDMPDPGDSIIGRKYKLNCTYWGFETSGTILDRGEASVYYPGGVAYFDDAYALSFDGDSAIPGCSGSAVEAT